jgi:hypothetical protein
MPLVFTVSRNPNGNFVWVYVRASITLQSSPNPTSKKVMWWCACHEHASPHLAARRLHKGYTSITLCLPHLLPPVRRPSAGRVYGKAGA